MSVDDGFPSDPFVTGRWFSLQRLGHSAGARRGAQAAFLWDHRRSTYTKLLHPVDQRRSLHPQALGRAVPSPDYPIACFQCTKDMITLYLRETIHGGFGFLGNLVRFQFGSWGA